MHVKFAPLLQNAPEASLLPKGRVTMNSMPTPDLTSPALTRAHVVGLPATPRARPSDLTSRQHTAGRGWDHVAKHPGEGTDAKASEEALKASAQ